jgi:hypothetical protein
MNVTSLPAGGANFRVYKTTANGSSFFGNPVALTPGSNTISVAAVAFNRAVKFQFSSGDVEFDDLSLNGVSSTCVGTAPPPSISLISACGDFVSGPTAWPYVLVATTIADGAASQGSKTFTMNVTSLPAGGANFRVYKTTANGSSFFGNPVALTLCSNTITVPAVTFDRAVKFQFSSGDVGFDALSVNGVASTCVGNITASVTDIVDACDSYTWIDGNTYTSSNNTSTHTLINANGCDSVVTLDLTITNVNSLVNVVNDSTLQAQSVAAGTIYQWVDCNDNFTPLAGETNPTFTTQNSGYYAVEVTLNDCSVISDCLTITNTVGIDDLDTHYEIQLFPNPTTSDLTISLEGNDFVDIIILDIQGKVLSQHLGLFDQDRINLSGYFAGTYFVKIMTQEGNREIRVTKQ